MSMNKRRLVSLMIIGVLLVAGLSSALAQDKEEVNVVHMWSGALGKATMDELFAQFNEMSDAYEVVDNSAGHEDFKTQILVTIAGDNPPDMFSYWAGARTQFVVDADRVMPLDDFWAENNLDEVFPAGLEGATTYNGEIYMIPMNVHIIGLFYNPHVMEDAGITEMPATWDEFTAVCDQLLDAGYTPIALGSRDRWPAQFWFDYLLNRSAGPEYRTALMNGEASYLDDEVVAVMEMWKDMIDKGYFVEFANAYDWAEAADIVASGEAAMTLIGTYATGYYNNNELEPGVDYDFFPFPIMNPDLPVVAHGAVNGWLIPSGASHPEGAQEVIKHMITVESQEAWAQGQGALAVANGVDPSIYNSVMAKAAEHFGEIMFLSGYDLSTVPEMADVGLNMFARFMDDPSGYMDYLEQAQVVNEEAYAD